MNEFGLAWIAFRGFICDRNFFVVYLTWSDRGKPQMRIYNPAFEISTPTPTAPLLALLLLSKYPIRTDYWCKFVCTSGTNERTCNRFSIRCNQYCCVKIRTRKTNEFLSSFWIWKNVTFSPPNSYFIIMLVGIPKRSNSFGFAKHWRFTFGGLMLSLVWCVEYWLRSPWLLVHTLTCPGNISLRGR